MKFFIENGTPTEEQRIQRWAQSIARALGIDDANFCVHIRLGVYGRYGGKMIPSIAPDRRLLLELDSTRESVLPSLSHELVHVRQIIRGDHYVDHCTGWAYWQGKVYNADAVIGRAKQDYKFYRSLPWEQEAHELMWPLAVQAARETGEA